jgi:hypothetical protein
MKIEDRVIELAVKKMTGEASIEEQQELNDLLQDDAHAQEALKVLLEEHYYEEPAPDDRSRLLFEKIKAKIEGNT